MSGEAPRDAARPWIEGDLVIGRAVLDGIHEHAKACYPSESCGFIAGPANEAPLLDAATRADNEADKYHALDPERFPRTSKTYFKINELKAARAFESGEAAGRPIKVIYHSHCDAGAYQAGESILTIGLELVRRPPARGAGWSLPAPGSRRERPRTSPPYPVDLSRLKRGPSASWVP